MRHLKRRRFGFDPFVMNRPPPTPKHDAPPNPRPASDDFRLPAPPAWLGWAVATVCLFAALFFAAKSFNVRAQLQAALQSEQVTRLEAGTLKNLLEAERILSRGQLERLASFANEPGTESLQVIILDSTANVTPVPRGAIVWSSIRREGLFVATALPTPPADTDHRLWLTTTTGEPVALGTISREHAEQPAEIRLPFRLDAPLPASATFVLTQEAGAHFAGPAGPPILTGDAP